MAAPQKSEAEAFKEFGHSLIEALRDIHRVDEVQNMLLIRLGEATVAVLVKTGLIAEAHALAEQFGMAAEVLKAGAALTKERLAGEEEE